MSGETTRPRRRRRWLRRSLALAYFLALAALSYGAFLAITDRYIERRRPVTLVYDPHPFRRVALAPGQSYRRHDVAFTINRHGLRGRSPGRKAEGELRVFVLGGSSVFDHLLGERQSWPERLGPYLAARGFAGARSYNAGVPGYSSREALALYTDVVRYFEPDVVLVYLGWNDAKYMRRFRRKVDVDRHFQARGADRYRFLTAERPLRNWYALLDVLRGLDRARTPLAEGDGAGEPARGNRGPSGRPARRTPAAEAAPWSETPGMDYWRDNVGGLVEAILRDGALPVLVAENTLAAADADPGARERIQYRFVGLRHGELVELDEAMVHALAEVAAEHGVPLIDLRHHFNGKLGYFIDHVHMTPLGSQRLAASVAGCLAPVLEARGFARRPVAIEPALPVAHWTFDALGNEIADAAPYGLEGVARGGVGFVAECRRGGCLSFDGGGSEVVVESRNPLHLSEHFSITLWVRPREGEIRGSRGLVVKPGAYHLALRGGRPAFYGYGLDPPGWHVAEAKVSPGAWHEIRFEHRGDRIRLLLDGGEVVLSAVRGEVDRSSRPLRIGGGNGFFAGELDDVRLELLGLEAGPDCTGDRR